MSSSNRSSLTDEILSFSGKGNDYFISFEYYPPRDAAGVTKLYNRIQQMKRQKPLFLDFTWGAGGSTSDLTIELATQAQKKANIPTNMHITCTNMKEEKIFNALKEAKEANVRNLVALRGDPPKGQEKWEVTKGGFACALDLVKHIRAKYDDFFNISVAGYPEGHPNTIKPVGDRELTESEKTRAVYQRNINEDGTLSVETFVCSDEDFAKEIAYLKEKVDAGAAMIITQMFFDVSVFLTFVKACRMAGITCPIIPGIMCIMKYGGFVRMTGMCKSRVPDDVWAALDAIKDDAAAVKNFGVDFGTKLCRDLLASGEVQGLHFYTLNLTSCTYAILKGLGRYIEPPFTQISKEIEHGATEMGLKMSADNARWILNAAVSLQ
jgi:methylenetetrahydrofolate reductase (NADPH)